MVCLKLTLLSNDAGFQTNCHQILMVKIISICLNMGMFSSFFQKNNQNKNYCKFLMKNHEDVQQMSVTR